MCTASQSSRTLFRQSSLDAVLVGVALLQGVGLCLLLTGFASRAIGPAEAAVASIVIALGLWWNSNTISHNHLHNPFFFSSAQNRWFSAYLTLLLGIPQSLWRRRHLQHHHGRPVSRGILRERKSRVEILLVVALFAALGFLAPRAFLFAYVPGYVLGLGLCFLQGFYEHRGNEEPAGIDYHGRFYNFLWLNDGFHREHHQFPREHWSRLPRHHREANVVSTSKLPPVLRWIEDLQHSASVLQASTLDHLERWSLRSKSLQQFMVARHRSAMAVLLHDFGKQPETVCIVGGGIFPRTVLVLGELLPFARLIVLDANRESIELAKAHLEARGFNARQIEFRHGFFDPRGAENFDLVIIPLGYRGDRAAFQRRPRPPIIVHDWVWRRRGARSATISLLILKRLNLILPNVRGRE